MYFSDANDYELNTPYMGTDRASKLGSALEAGRFQLYFQPIYALSGTTLGEPAFLEILLRLEDFDGHLLSPSSFLPVAESLGIMTSIDRWLVRTALVRFSQSGAIRSGCSVSLNLSGGALAEATFLDYVCGEVEGSKIPAQSICFEITEADANFRISQVARFIQELRKLGCTVILDKFGRGLSRLPYLCRLPVNFLKIDGGFLRNPREDGSERSMAGAIHKIGEVLGLGTIAECVNSQDTVNQLRDMGIGYAQGYAFGPPAPLDQLLPVT